MTNIQDQFGLMKLVELWAFACYITRREKQCLIQFLMALCSDFEVLCGTILRHNSLPFVDSMVSEVLAKKIWLKS